MMRPQLNKLALASLILLGACSDASFQGGAARSANVKPPDPPPTLPPGSLKLNMHVNAGQKNIDLLAGFEPAKKPASDHIGNYNLISGTVVTTDTDGLSPELAAAIKSATMLANITKDGDQYSVTITLNIPTFKSKNGDVPAQVITITQKSSDLSWLKDEGPTDKFGKLDSVTTTSGCKIESSGNMPRPGLHAVVLTKPAACDFILPTLKIGGRKGQPPQNMPVGSYWLAGGTQAHNFGVNTQSTVWVDNGFILVQPDGKSYLLADAGNARAGGRSANDSANDVSHEQGFGNTVLLKPNPGDPQNNYQGATVFKKGSVIALYDDTPDMGGTLDVAALVSSAETGGVKLNWSAEVVK